MNIGGDLQRRLVSLIEKEVILADKYEGRDALLIGITNQIGWQRSLDKHIDLFKITEHLQNHFRGDSESIDTWGLLLFINNAIYATRETATAKKLQELRDQCIQCWNQEQQKHFQVIPLTTTDHSAPLQQEQICVSIISSEELSPAAADQLSPRDDFSHFFETSELLIQTLGETIESAKKLYCSPFKASALVKRRIALRYVEEVLQCLRQLGIHLEIASPLPEIIAKQRHILRGQICYLIEQTQALQSWIDISNGAHESILEKFEIVERGCAELHILKGKGEAPQSNM